MRNRLIIKFLVKILFFIVLTLVLIPNIIFTYNKTKESVTHCKNINVNFGWGTCQRPLDLSNRILTYQDSVGEIKTSFIIKGSDKYRYVNNVEIPL